MSFISKGLKLGAYISAVVAVVVGVVLFSSIPTKLGFYRWMATRDPLLIGMTPAHSYGIPWKFTFDDLYSLDLKGQTAIVTGANSGIGYALTEALAKLGAEVTMACRDAARCEQAALTIRADPLTKGTIKTMVVDTGSLASVRTFAQAYVAANEGKALDMLFLNAGGYYSHPKNKSCVPENADGIETTFAANYLGHHLLYRWMEPLLEKSQAARVVSTSSALSFQTYTYHVATDLQTLNGCSESYMSSGMNLSYGQSKLAQIVWSKYVARQLGDDSNVFVNAFHPGAAATAIMGKSLRDLDLPNFTQDVANWVQRETFWTPAEGALTGLYLGAAVDQLKRDSVRGKYFHPQSQEVVNEFAVNETLQDKLWDFSEELVRDYLPPLPKETEVPPAEDVIVNDEQDEEIAEEEQEEEDEQDEEISDDEQEGEDEQHEEIADEEQEEEDEQDEEMADEEQEEEDQRDEEIAEEEQREKGEHEEETVDEEMPQEPEDIAIEQDIAEE